MLHFLSFRQLCTFCFLFLSPPSIFVPYAFTCRMCLLSILSCFSGQLWTLCFLFVSPPFLLDCVHLSYVFFSTLYLFWRLLVHDVVLLSRHSCCAAPSFLEGRGSSHRQPPRARFRNFRINLRGTTHQRHSKLPPRAHRARLSPEPTTCTPRKLRTPGRSPFAQLVCYTEGVSDSNLDCRPRKRIFRNAIVEAPQ